MPLSEAALDTPRDQVATRYLELTDYLGPVSFVRGVAQGPMARREAERLQGVLGPDFIITGPWPPAAPTPPIESSSPPAPARASEPEGSPLRAPTRRTRRP